MNDGEDMINHMDKKSLRYNLWKSFILLSASIMIILWMLQTVFINGFYKTMKVNEIKKLGNSLVLEYGNEGFGDLLYTTSIKEGLAIYILDETGSLIYPLDIFDVLRPLRLDFRSFTEFLNNLFESDEKHVIYTKEDPRLGAPILVYGAILVNDTGSNYFLYINSILQPIDSTINVLKNQLIIVTLLSLCLSAIMSYFISQKLSSPMEKLTNSAKELAKGNYDIEFQKGDYTEIDNLSNALNYATSELSITEDLRKDLIANVSHDLKTPLTIIKSYGEMIRDISGNNEEKRRKHLQVIIDESDKLTKLVNDILDLSKAQHNLNYIEKVPFNILESCKNTLKRFSYFSDNEGFQFIIKTNGNVQVIGDEKKIEQVIYNLLSNAINYSGDNKIITINILDEGELVNLQVIDNGLGIPKDEIEHIWDRYYRGGKNHKREGAGTGIGLALVKSILKAHNEEFGVESEEGIGSVFYFKLRTLK